MVLGKNSVKLNNTTIQPEFEPKDHCTHPNLNSVVSLHYNGNESYLYIDGKEQYKFKQCGKFSVTKMFLGNITD